MHDLNRKVAVITGAASGIGRELAVGLAREGCHLAIVDNNREGLQDTVERIGAVDRLVTMHELDVSRCRLIQGCADDIMRKHGAIHILINNAGVLLSQDVDHTTYRDFHWVMNNNFWGVVYGTMAFLPILRRQPEAHIVNIASGYALAGAPNRSAYSAAKFAVRGFTEALQQDLRGSNIVVSCAYPGGTRTNLAANARFYRERSGSIDRFQFERLFREKARTSSGKAAALIIDGIKKNKKRILVGKDAKIIDLVQRLFPVRCHEILFP